MCDFPLKLCHCETKRQHMKFYDFTMRSNECNNVRHTKYYDPNFVVILPPYDDFLMYTRPSTFRLQDKVTVAIMC